MKEDPAAILRKRARLLAQPAEPAGGGETLEVLEFKLSEGSYCLEMAFINDVQPLVDVTSLPGTPAFVVGLMATRGQIRCVLDPKVLLGLEKAPPKHPKVVLLSDGAIEFGILVDGVSATRRVETSAVQPPLPGPSRFVRGMVDRVILLDAKALISDPGIVVYQGETS